MSRAVECVIVGHNEEAFDDHVRSTKQQAMRSGAYEDVKTNSVLLDDRRLRYMDLLNEAIHDSTGQPSTLSVFRLPHLGACYLTTALRRRGIRTELVNSFSVDRDRLRAILGESPAVVAITTTYYVHDEPIREVVDFVRAHAPDTLIVVGGPRIHAICADHDPVTQDYIFQQDIGADIYITDSQGESTLVALLLALREPTASLQDVPNLVLGARGASPVRTARRAENNALDENVVDWSLFPADFVRPTVTIRTARSCPYSCAFCNYPTMAGEHVLTSLDVVEREFRVLHEIGVRFLNIIDDTFNVPLPRFKDLLRMMIRNRFGFQWISFLRCGNTDDETFDLMREAGCVAVLLGIESGDPAVLRHMNKKATPDRYRYGIARLNAVGIASFASVIIGFPGETDDSVRVTAELIEQTEPTFFNAQLYYHDKQSPIHRRAKEFGLRGAGYAWSHDGMTWQRAATWMRTLFREIAHSTPLSLDGFHMWAFMYLLQHGIDVPRIREFGRVVRPMLVRGFDEESTDRRSEDYQRLLALFAPREAVARADGASVTGASRAPRLVWGSQVGGVETREVPV